MEKRKTNTPIMQQQGRSSSSSSNISSHKEIGVHGFKQDHNQEHRRVDHGYKQPQGRRNIMINAAPPYPSHHRHEEVVGSSGSSHMNKKHDGVEKREIKVEESVAKKVALESKPSMDIDKSADEFIKKFRKQLLIQRLDSIENYQQILARGL